MRRPRFHPEAGREFDDALTFIAKRSPAAAARFAHRVAEAIELITAFPDVGRILTGPFRAFPVHPFSYDLVYKSEADGQLTILAVAHQRRRPGYWRQRSP